MSCKMLCDSDGCLREDTFSSLSWKRDVSGLSRFQQLFGAGIEQLVEF